METLPEIDSSKNHGDLERRILRMKIFTKPNSMSANAVPYCPGCGHGMALRLVGEAIDELGILENVIGISPVGCAVRSWRLYRFDVAHAAHGRPPAVATGLKRARPENVVFAYQGDGDSAAIGLSELMHAALRCEKITVFMINNAIYGATGGQMAPTTLIGQYSTSYPRGRDPSKVGYPIKMAELIASISKNAYASRVALNNVKNIVKVKEGITKAFKTQMKRLGFSFVEILSPCPTGWKMTPLQALEWIEKKMIPEYPLGEYAIPDGL
jgi:2-oxoglutarate ferredoxin oxidoreductase subunit beta